MQTCHHNPSSAVIGCTNLDQQQLLQLLMMFVAYCINILKTTPTSIPSILSGLKNNLGARFIVVDAFQHPLLTNMKTAIAKIPYSPRISLPCTYNMITHIIQRNTVGGFTKDQFMLAVGVAMAYYLCLRASEYASKTKVPDPESHQFDSKSVEFKCFGSNNLLPSSQLQTTRWKDIEIIRFTIQHAKNIKKGYGVPIWFSTREDNADAVAFLQLVYLWSQMSQRQEDDPFLSYRTKSGTLHCLVYTTVHEAIAKCAAEFGFNPKWFKPHGVRKAGPTVLRAAGRDDGDILLYGRWKGVPTSLIYQGSSTTNNNRLLRQVCNETLFTEDDIRLSMLLPSSKGQNQLPQVRRF